MTTATILPSCPTAGTGVHSWIMQVAWRLRGEGSTADQAADWIRSNITRRPSPPREIEQAVAKVYDAPITHREYSHAPKWPPLDREKRTSIVGDGFALVDLWEASPVRFTQPATEEIIGSLFPADCLLCMAPDNRSAITKPLAEWRGHMGENQLLVPSPMAAIKGMTQGGRDSYRCLENVGTRRYIICEFDSGSVDEQAAILRHLGSKAPLVMAVHSGGKSLHGWFRAHADETITRRFFRHAVELGADSATWTQCQLVRTPDAKRDNGNPQTVYFFNPEASHARN